MSQYATNQFRKGLKIEIEKVPYEIVDFQHVSPGKGRAFTRTKVKNMLNGNVTEKTITSEEERGAGPDPQGTVGAPIVGFDNKITNVWSHLILTPR